MAAPVEAKVKAATGASLAVGVAVAILNAVVADGQRGAGGGLHLRLHGCGHVSPPSRPVP